MLLDTGAQVSIIPVKSLEQHLENIAARQLSEFLDTCLKFDSSEWDPDPLRWLGGIEAEIKLLKL